MTYKLNIKAISLAETLLDKPFSDFDFTDENTVASLMYAIYIANTGSAKTFEDFKTSVPSDVEKSTQDAMAYVMQFNRQTEAESDVPASTDRAVGSRMSELANYVIIHGGLDPHYVMYEMDVHEMSGFVEGINELKKEQMEEQRLWTYYTILPHVGNKVLKEPSDLIVFGWEAAEKQAAMDKMLDEAEAKLEKFLKEGDKINGR